jgi:ankyrin repeat protein
MRAFLQSAKDGDAGALRALLDAGGAELLEFRGAGTPDGVSGNTAAHWAAARGHTAALEVLLRAGAPVGATNHGGSTALQAAVLNSHAEVVRLLRRHGADADAQDEYGDSALDLAQVRERQRGLAAVARALNSPRAAVSRPDWTRLRASAARPCAGVRA